MMWDKVGNALFANDGVRAYGVAARPSDPNYQAAYWTLGKRDLSILGVVFKSQSEACQHLEAIAAGFTAERIQMEASRRAAIWRAL